MPQGLKQLRNEQLVRNLSADFQAKYDAAYHWSRACSMIQALPGLRGFWPMSAVGTGGEAQDLSSHAMHLSRNGGLDFYMAGLIPACAYGSGETPEWHEHADNAVFDIIGTESYIDSNYHGLTLGGWFKFDDDPPAASEYLMAKWSTTPNRSYRLIRLTDTTIQFSIGDTIVSVTTTETTTDDTWYFCWGRYNNDDLEIDVGINDGIKNLAVGVPGSITPGTADFTIAARDGGSEALDGSVSMCWLSGASLTDAIVLSVFEHQKAMYNVR